MSDNQRPNVAIRIEDDTREAVGETINFSLLFQGAEPIVGDYIYGVGADSGRIARCRIVRREWNSWDRGEACLTLVLAAEGFED